MGNLQNTLALILDTKISRKPKTSEGKSIPEYNPHPPKTDSVLMDVLGTTDGTILQRMPRLDRNSAIIVLRERGLSIRTIERRTGISRGIIQNIM